MTHTIKPEILDELHSGLLSPEDLMGDAGLLRQLKKALMERALSGELTHHLGYEKHDSARRRPCSAWPPTNLKAASTRDNA